jgi:pilus assembly protein CpaB
VLLREQIFEGGSMSRSRLFLLGLIALALGGFLAMQVYGKLQSRTSASTPASTDVLVAARDIQVGARIVDADVRTAKYPTSELPAGSFSGKSAAKVIGRGAILPITKGEFFLPSKLAAENSGSGLPSLIPPGMRAVSVRVNDVVSVAGFVVPGTRVDVLLTGTPPGSKEPVTTTVLENALVRAVGQRIEGTSGDPQTAPVITLLVSPEDAQKLTLATSEGRIQLSLRNLVDSEQQNLDLVRDSALYRGSSPPPDTSAKPRVAKAKPTAPTPPAVYSVEVIRGHDLSTTKF